MARTKGRRIAAMLDQGKATRAMIWIMAIMVFLTVLAAALGLATTRATQALDRDLAGRLTVQVVEGNAARRDDQVARILTSVRRVPGVDAATEVDRAELAELVRPWLGDAGLDPDLPMPAMIDVDLADGADSRVAAIELVVRGIAPGARVDRHVAWLAPVRDFLSLLTLLAGGVVLLMLVATGAVVLLSAKSGLDTHRDTIDVLHMLGSTDPQLSRLFQRRVGADTLLGGAIGATAGIAVVALLQVQVAALGSGVTQGASLATTDWIMLAAIPIGLAIIAMIAARIGVSGQLRKTL